MAGFTITIAGDSALNLEFAHAISAETSAKIRMAADNLTADPIRGITELVPTFDELSTKLRSKLRDVGEADLSIRKIVPIPVCYGGEFGPDLANVAQLAGLSEDEVIAIHTERDYLIDMLGFLPGFAYLGGLDERLHTPRLAVPRTRIEPGSVGIGGAQTGIYPLASPGGWQIIGRTPLKPYDPDREEPILYAAGEYLRFVPITPDEYTAIEAQLAAGTYSYGIFVEGE